MGKWKTLIQEGMACFATATIVGYIALFDRESYLQILIDNVNFYRNKYGFKLLGYVFMPEHLHFIILPKVGTTISNILRDFKTYTSKQLTTQLRCDDRTGFLDCLAEFATVKVTHPIWMEGNKPIPIYSEKVLRLKLNYIHWNPVKRGLVEKPADYLYSSYRNYYLRDHSVLQVDTDWYF